MQLTDYAFTHGAFRDTMLVTKTHESPSLKGVFGSSVLDYVKKCVY